MDAHRAGREREPSRKKKASDRKSDASSDAQRKREVARFQKREETQIWVAYLLNAEVGADGRGGSVRFDSRGRRGAAQSAREVLGAHLRARSRALGVAHGRILRLADGAHRGGVRLALGLRGIV